MPHYLNLLPPSSWLKSLAILLCASPGLLVSSTTTERRPNVVFIYTDDQAAWTVGCYGNKEAKTPNLDRLAAQGARLTNSLVSTPVCSPSRASLFTSHYASELGINDFIMDPTHSRFKSEDGKVGLPKNFAAFPDLLVGAGYSTGLVGKWHLGDWTKDPSRRFHPTNYGFQYFMGLTGGGTTPNNAPLEKERVVQVHEGLTDDVLTREGIAFIERNRHVPFFLFLALRSPHRQWLPVAEEDWKAFADLDPTIPNPDYPNLDTPRVKLMMREYLASVAGVDRNVGEVLAALDRLHLADNTLVIFSSDNGYNLGHNGIYHKANGIWLTSTPQLDTENINGRYRPNLYDNSLRVPAIVRWPGRIKPGTTINETVSNLDWFPTILAFAGVELPRIAPVRGRNFLPLLVGAETVPWENGFYAEYSMRHYCRTDMRAYRTNEWKLIRDYLNPERDELYNLLTDPEESHNLINNIHNPVVLDAIALLDARIMEKMKHHDDPALQLLSRAERAAKGPQQTRSSSAK